jgi:hypothetical protein
LNLPILSTSHFPVSFLRRIRPVVALIFMIAAGLFAPLAIAAAPVVSAVDSTETDGYFLASDSIDITVQFDQSVTVDTTGGAPQLTLNSGGVATYSSGSPGTTLTFTYTVASGENVADLDYASTTALSLNGGTILLTAAPNTAATLTLPSPGAEYSLGGNRDLVIDTTRPTLNSMIVSNATTLVLSFSESMDETLAETATNYTLSGTGGLTLNPSAAVLDITGKLLTLTVGSMATITEGKTVVVTAANTLTDAAGNLISNIARTASITLDLTPNAISFVDVNNAPAATAVTSAAATVGGISGAVSVSVVSDSSATLKCAVLPAGTSTWGAPRRSSPQGTKSSCNSRHPRLM